MIAALIACGIIVLISSVIVGVFSGSFFGFILAVIGGVFSSVIFFALAKIIDNQETMLLKIYKLEDFNRKQVKKEDTVCSKCNYTYDQELNSCPKCGWRPS
ncbi:hypothetical protein [Radiobacillus sp. PE A8.2]|uniref:hypothetical protein n=1 Tax=Radiobacillus sp. PE A8.2 TaxID=3380349 RepID=UPI00388D12AC